MKYDNTKSSQAKELAIHGLKCAEIADKLESTTGSVSMMMHRLRKDPTFNLKFSNAGKPVNNLIQAMSEVYYRFHTMHGFEPKASWVAKLFNCSRQHVSKNKPSLATKVGFTRVDPMYLSDSCVEFMDNYAEVFGITRNEAIRSFSKNMEWSGVDFKAIRKEMEDFRKELAGEVQK